jgi:hypothetical protein
VGVVVVHILEVVAALVASAQEQDCLYPQGLHTQLLLVEVEVVA